MKKVAVFVGRFQPVALAHQEIIEKAKKEFDELVVIIGSDGATCSLRNPFSTEIRRKMLESVGVKPENILSIRDSYYNFNWWVQSIYELVEKWRKINIGNGVEISIIGHYKDIDSYWLNAFPKWKFFDSGKLENNIGATIVRFGFFNKLKDAEPFTHDYYKIKNFSQEIPNKIYEMLKEWKDDNIKTWNTLNEEMKFVTNYKKKWEDAPYPPIFTTVDSLIEYNDHTLLIKRGKLPGKGLFALPGGFLEPNEKILDGAFRELYEETNIKLDTKYLKQMLRKVKVFDDIHRDERGRIITHLHHFDCYCTKIGIFPEITAGDDANEVMWYPIKKLNKISNQFYSDHFKIIMNILEKK